MDKKLKSKWINALRSGRYEQARGTLLALKSGGMCCLGVLATIQGCDLRKKKNDDPSFCLVSRDLPRGFNAGLRTEQREQLATMNDSSGSSFKQIADYIEKRL